MKIQTLAGVLAIAGSISIASGQEFPTSVHGGAKALLFTFSGLSNLGANSYNGGVGGKYYLSDPLAIRGGLQFSYFSQNVAANPPAGTTGEDGSASAFRLGLNAAAEYHLTTNRLSPYFGGAINFTTTSTETETAVVGNPPGPQTTTKNGTAGVAGFFGGLNFGLGLLAGAEFFLTREISLGAEYVLGFSMLSPYDQKVTSGSTTVTTEGNSSWTLNAASTGTLILAVYF
jgi:opacity protein-like surface antigen